MIKEPILTSMLDDDFYKFSMGSVAFHLFPRAIVTYEFFNRGKTKFPKGFVDVLRFQIDEFMSYLRLTGEEAVWINTLPYMRPTYVEWLKGYRMNPDEVKITQEGGDLRIKIVGPWYRTIYWEVKLMATISELYFRITGANPADDWVRRIENKSVKLQLAKCHWIDFGTRRRFSQRVQDSVVSIMKNFRGFLGTSNPHLAFKYGVTPHGTYAHESVMAMSALYGDFNMANKMWMKHWSDHFDGNVGVALSDTFTTQTFLKSFGTYEAKLFDGVRQDSGDPIEWGNKMLEHYKRLGIPTTNKRFVFSDALTTNKYITLSNKFHHVAQPIGGIGTHFTNDCGAVPLNIVIKMTSADFGFGPVDVIKLSDDTSKATGNAEKIKEARKKLNIL